MQKLGQTIYRLRKEHNVTQTQLAEFLFVTPQTVSKWESGNGTPDISLLPRLASFFQISMDDLFGITKLDQLEDMVSRYSVLRDEESFHRTLQALDLSIRTEEQKKTILKESAENMGGSKASEEGDELLRLLALKAHLFLQNIWDSLEKANLCVDRANDILADQEGNEWFLRFVMQKIHFRLMKGEYRAVRRECEEDFERNPCPRTLYVYLEVLNMLGDFETIINLVEKDTKVKRFLEVISRDNTNLWIVYILAEISLGMPDAAKETAERIYPFCRNEQKLEVMMALEAASGENESRNNRSAVNADDSENMPPVTEHNEHKRSLYKLLEQCFYNDYIKMGIRRRIDEL